MENVVTAGSAGATRLFCKRCCINFWPSCKLLQQCVMSHALRMWGIACRAPLRCPALPHAGAEASLVQSAVLAFSMRISCCITCTTLCKTHTPELHSLMVLSLFNLSFSLPPFVSSPFSCVCCCQPVVCRRRVSLRICGLSKHCRRPRTRALQSQQKTLASGLTEWQRARCLQLATRSTTAATVGTFLV